MTIQEIERLGDRYGYAPDGKIKVNAHAFIDLKGNEFFFSYQTLIAFRPVKGAFADICIVRQNEWGTTTGKHLGWIDGGQKATRVARAEFELLYKLHITDQD